MLSMMAASARHRRENRVEQWCEQTPVSNALLHVEHFLALAMTQPHACLHAIVELAVGEHSVIRQSELGQFTGGFGRRSHKKS